MSERPNSSPESAEFWKKVLVDGEGGMRFCRSVFRKLPSSPRCKLCVCPFASVGGWVLRLTRQFAPSRKNPTFCNG